ncbi:MAG: hypothetical protein LBV39_01360 [Bacteroidales bacterium]|jgi:hypothetical protein|nr:hypothetical protein [Bacteroidales bacterium]
MLQYPQKEGVIKQVDSSGNINFDPLLIKTFADLTRNLSQRAAPAIRKKGFENYLRHNEHETFGYQTASGKKANIYVIAGAEYNDSEFHSAEKLAKAGYHVVFPNKGALGKERKNDIYLYDTKTYAQQKVEIKSLFGTTSETVSAQIISGSGQAGIIAYDIQSGIKKNRLIDGLRKGWSKNTKRVMINWHGQWYDIEEGMLFTQSVYDILK